MFDVEKVYPRIKKNWAKNPLEEVTLLNYETQDGKLNAPMLRIRESFVEIFMQDVGDGYVYLDYDMLPDDVNIDELSDKAFENLKRDISFRMVEGKEKGIYGLAAGGDFEAEVLLCSGIWQECAKTLGGDLIFTIPTKDMVIFALADDKKIIKNLLKMSKEVFERNKKESPELLFCKDVFKYSVADDEWEITKELQY